MKYLNPQLWAGLPRGLGYKLSRRLLRVSSRKRQFETIYKRGGFGGSPSLSGAGSDLVQTERIRAELPLLLARRRIRTILDAPCGDWYWMQHVDLTAYNYIGADLVEGLVVENNRRFGKSNRRFIRLDICKDPIPEVDLVLCRDCLIHLRTRDCLKAMQNIRSSGSKYILTTTYPQRERNEELPVEFWRPLNLKKPPFCLPVPLEMITEGSTERGGEFADKSLALWRVQDLPE